MQKNNSTRKNSKKLNISTVDDAAEVYKSEFGLHSQIKGMKRIGFTDIQDIWEEVINRRIIEGEKDKISIYLRGYLGTDQYDSAKSRIINLISTNKLNERNLYDSEIEEESERPKKIPQKIISRWTYLMEGLLKKQSYNLSKQISEKDSAADVFYKISKNIKYIRHRLDPTGKSKSRTKVIKNSDTNLLYGSDKWFINSPLGTPIDAPRLKSRIKFIKSRNFSEKNAKSKTPVKEKLLGETTKLPYII